MPPAEDQLTELCCESCWSEAAHSQGAHKMSQTRSAFTANPGGPHNPIKGRYVRHHSHLPPSQHQGTHSKKEEREKCGQTDRAVGIFIPSQQHHSLNLGGGKG